MHVALIQMNTQDDKRANLAEAARLIGEAAATHPRLVVLPEMFSFLASDDAGRRANAEPIPGGETYRFLQDCARRHGIYLHGGSILEAGPDKLYNTSLVFDPAGIEVARYRKIHLFDVTTPDGKVYRESDAFARGEAIVTYALDGVTVGCSICYDLRFPELYQALARRGAQVIVAPSAFTLQTGKDHWEVLVRARAVETQTYLLAPNQIGTHARGTRANWGHSMAVDPWGAVVAQASDRVGFVAAQLDFGYLARVRAMIPVAEHKVL